MKEFFFSLKSYNGVLRKNQGCFMQLSWIRNFKEISGPFKGVWREFGGSFEGTSEVLRVIQGSFRAVSKVLQKRVSQKSFKGISEVLCV